VFDPQQAVKHGWGEFVDRGTFSPASGLTILVRTPRSGRCWGWNLGLHACWANPLPLSYTPKPISRLNMLLGLFFEICSWPWHRINKAEVPERFWQSHWGNRGLREQWLVKLTYRVGPEESPHSSAEEDTEDALLTTVVRNAVERRLLTTLSSLVVHCRAGMALQILHETFIKMIGSRGAEDCGHTNYSGQSGGWHTVWYPLKLDLWLKGWK
jgi:hypothetical protein